MKILQPNNKKITKIIHIADIHIRLNKRKDEYTEIFNKFFDLIKLYPIDETIICILGDVFHSKNDLQPEAIELCNYFLRGCANLFPTILIAGNHDAILSNKNRLDSLTPIIDALNNTNLFYMKDNGLYSLGDILFNNMSVFSDPIDYITYDKVPKNYKNEYRHHIALYHGPVNSALTDLGFHFVNKAMPVEIFDGHHIALLGDIHKMQDLQHFDDLNSKPAVRYCGSLLQQNHGESMDGHGFSLWDLKTKTYNHINISNDYGFFTVEVNKGKLVTDLTNIPKKARVRVNCFESVASEIKEVVSNIKTVSKVDDVSYNRVNSPNDPAKLKIHTNINLADIADITYQNKLLSDFLKNKCNVIDQTLIDSVLSINTKLNGSIEKDKFAKNVRWKPKKFEFDNMFSYGEGNVIDFAKAKDVMGLFAPNASGKSSIFSALSFCLFDKFDRGYKAIHVLNVQKSSFRCKFNFEINGVDFFIERKGQLDKKGNVKVDVKFWKEISGNKVDLNGEARRNTNDVIKDCVGSYEDFILTALSVQSAKNVTSFIDMGQSERKDLLAQFIGLSIFDNLLEMANDQSKDITASLKAYKNENHETNLKSYTNESESLTSVFNDETTQTSLFKESRNVINDDVLAETKKLKPIDGKVIDIKQVREEIPRKKLQIQQYKDTNTDTNTKILKLDGVIKEFDLKIVDLDKKDISNSMKKYQLKKSELDHINQLLELKKVEGGNKSKKLKLLKEYKYDPNCKFCTDSVFVKDAVQTERSLNQDITDVKKLRVDEKSIKTEVDNLTWVVKAQDDYNNLLKQRNVKKDEHNNLSASVRVIEKNIVKLEAELESLNKDEISYKTQVDSIEYNKKIQITIDLLQQKLRNLDFDIDKRNKNLAEINGRLMVLKNQIQQLKDTIEKVKQYEKEYESYALYIKAVNRDGLPYMVISNTVPEIEQEVNNILNQMVDFHLNIETDGKNITPYIVYDDRQWPIEMASGFEKFVSSLAIRVALINVSNLPRPSLMIVDEGFGVIDSNNMPSVQTLFSFLKNNFDCIIIISHLDALRDMVDKHIDIKVDNGFSSVNFV